MKRWICGIMVCPLLGVVTTAGVAWGCARWSVTTAELAEEYWPDFPVEVTQGEYDMLAQGGVVVPNEMKVARSDIAGFGFRRESYWALWESMFEPPQPEAEPRAATYGRSSSRVPDGHARP